MAKRKVHHYTESGLDNVYLAGGFSVHQTPHGEGVSIENTDRLHLEIGRWLISKPTPLTGAEFRFLRVEMEITQRDLAALFRMAIRTLLLWEGEQNRAKPVPGNTDRLMRGRLRRVLGRQAKPARCTGTAGRVRWRCTYGRSFQQHQQPVAGTADRSGDGGLTDKARASQ